ncbi:MAG: hypothetical protein HDT40_01205 [Lachnospiraceae bacterium]|nr:hypothetical protein [Lachnospiraceae bacterium]
MERRKYLKKTCLYFVLSMVLVASLAGCLPARKIKITGKYREWGDAIGINKNPDVYCTGYYEYADGVEIYIRTFDYETADEFKKIIDNHNAFVTRNPDYFSEDFDIDILFEGPGGSPSMRFSNRTDSDSDKGTTRYIELSAIETEKTHRMRYVYPERLDDEIKTKFEAETIIISIGTYIDKSEKANDWSENFGNFDTIVVKIIPEVEREINVEEALKKIQRANPDVEIYCKTYPNELRKYVPDENSN